VISIVTDFSFCSILLVRWSDPFPSQAFPPRESYQTLKLFSRPVSSDPGHLLPLFIPFTFWGVRFFLTFPVCRPFTRLERAASVSVVFESIEKVFFFSPSTPLDSLFPFNTQPPANPFFCCRDFRSNTEPSILQPFPPVLELCPPTFKANSRDGNPVNIEFSFPFFSVRRPDRQIFFLTFLFFSLLPLQATSPRFNPDSKWIQCRIEPSG